MSDTLHTALDNLIAGRAAALDGDSLHLYPFYGEVYADVLNIAAGLDFNFMFEWGPRLQPHERVVIEVLVFLAREQARRAAFDTALRGERQEVPVEIYIERVPTHNALDPESSPRAKATLAGLTNLKRDRIYDALKCENVCHFVKQEPSRRIHIAGRVVTAPARFSVRVDPVPTPEQECEIRLRIASRSIEAELLTSPTATSVTSGIATSLTSPKSIPLTSPMATPVLGDLMSRKRLMSDSATSASLSSWSRSQRHDSGILGNPSESNVSVTAAGASETTEAKSRLVAEWRKTSEDLARHSAKELSDEGSVGYHILVWNHARKHDRLSASHLTDDVFAILTDLAVRRTKSGKPQGRAWTQRTRSLFMESGVPLVLNAAPGDGLDADEIRAIMAESLSAADAAGASPAAEPVPAVNNPPSNPPSSLDADMSRLMDRRYEALDDGQRKQLDAQALAEVAGESAFFADALANGKRYRAIENRIADRRRALLASGWADRNRR